MIDVALTFINDYIVSEISSSVTVKVASLPKDPDSNTTDNIYITLLNVEEERVIKSQPAYKPYSNSAVRLYNPEIRLNLYLLFTAQFSPSQYLSGLKYISKVISIFQGKYVFTTDDFGTTYAGLEKLIVELYSPTFEQNNQIWQILGSRMMPFVLYKVRMVSLVDTDDDYVRQIEIVQGINFDLNTDR
jgi:hypothetical protein